MSSDELSLLTEPEFDDEGGRTSVGRIRSLIGVVALVVASIALWQIVTRAPAGGSGPVPGGSQPGRADAARVGSGPLLGDPLGLVIAIGGGSEPIHILDLDTGDVSAAESHGIPELLQDGRVLVKDDQGTWGLIDVLEAGPPVPLPLGGLAESTSAVAAEAGGVWFRHAPDGGSDRDWSRIEPATGVVLERVTVPAGAEVVTDAEGRALAGPEVVGSATGGVFVLDDDGGYRRVLDGRLIAFSERLLLVSTCGRFLLCRNEWIDRESLEVLDIPAPVPELGGAFIRGDNVLVAETPGGSGFVVKVFDVATGRAIATGSPSGLSRSWVSPSGRFVAVPGFNALLIIDVQDGGTAIVGQLTVGPGVQAVWGRAPEGR